MINSTIQIVQVVKPENFKINVIIGMSHFIKSVEDISEAVLNSHPDAKFGLAFCEASGKQLIRTFGTSKKMLDLAIENAKLIGTGHSFILFLNGIFPINIIHSLRTVPEILNIYCATSNPVQVIICETEQGRGIIGVIDGGSPKGVETSTDKVARHTFLREIGYKF